MALVIIAAGLGYAGVTQSLAIAVEARSPGKAHALAPNNGFITGRLAATLSGLNANAEDRTQSDRFARLALQQDPTSLDAAVTLGLNAQLEGDTASTRHLFTYAAALSRRNLQTQIWAIGDSVARNDVRAALLHYDIALRTSPNAPNLLFPVLASAVLDPVIRNALVDRLADRPAWTDSFVYYIVTNDTHPIATVALLQSLSRRGVKISDADSAILIKDLIHGGAVTLAWQYYRAMRPSVSRSQSRNPDFNIDGEAPSLFDWVPINTGAISSAIQPSDNGGGVLNFAAPPSVGGPVVQQIELLPPGEYILNGRSRGLSQPEGAQPYWSFRCRDGHELGRVDVPNSMDRQGRFSGRFTVPDNCAVQILELILRPSSQISGITGQIDNAMLRPVEQNRTIPMDRQG